MGGAQRSELLQLHQPYVGRWFGEEQQRYDLSVLLSRMSFPGSYLSRHHRRVVQLRDTRCRRRGEYGGADRDDFLRSESGSCVSACVACVVTQKTVVGSQAHAPPPVLYTLAPRSACLSAYPALLWRTHHVRAIRGYTAPGGHAYLHVHCTHTLRHFAFSPWSWPSPPRALS